MPVVPVAQMTALDPAPKRPNMVQAKKSAGSDGDYTVFDLSRARKTVNYQNFNGEEF